MRELTSGKWQGLVWLEHRVKLSSVVRLRLCSRHRVTEDTFRSSATQSCSFSLLQVNWREGRRQAGQCLGSRIHTTSNERIRF